MMVQTEAQLERRLVRGVKAIGGVAYKFISPGNAGLPDRLVLLPGGHVLFAELKTDTGKLTPLQKLRIVEIQRQGLEVHLVRGVPGVAAFLNLCREKIQPATAEDCPTRLVRPPTRR